jgi:hypothetical protein
LILVQQAFCSGSLSEIGRRFYVFSKRISYGLSLFLIILMINPVLMVGTAQEVDLHLQDSDKDGISDWDEINRYGSNPQIDDSDGDLIKDGREVTTGTNPMDPDSDGDGFPDFDEYAIWNPEASYIPNRWYRCPYVADIPEISTRIVDNKITKHMTFTKGGESHIVHDETGITQQGNTSEVDARVGLAFQAWVGTEYGAGWSTNDWGMPVPEAGWGVVGGIRLTFDSGASYTWKSTTVKQDETKDQNILDNYTRQFWEYSEATLHLNVEIINSYNREIRLDQVVFDLLIGAERFSSEVWAPSPAIVLAPGEEYSVDVSFVLESEEWIHQLTLYNIDFTVDQNSVEISIFDEESNEFVSADTMSRRIQDRCVVVNIPNSPWGPIRKYITATIDKLDGLNVLTAFDRLFLPYTYRYGRLTSLMGTESRPYESVWSFLYLDVWHDPNTHSNETNLVELNMWGRGALLLSLDVDSDGDWLPDRIEERVKTNPYDPDSDDDYADDYVEIVLSRSNPLEMDTDGGGMLDGIEYFEGLDANDPTDDKLNPPDWYMNHVTMNTAKAAADLLLKSALTPAGDQITWSMAHSPAAQVLHEYIGEVSYVTNETIRQGDDESILSIDIGDVDNDNISEIVYLTAPTGSLILLDFDENEGVWKNETIEVFSDLYGISPILTGAVCIGDANNIVSDGNEIVVGTTYFDTGYAGRLHMYFKAGTWQSVDIGPPIEGGVYSIDIGNTCGKNKNVIAVGQGGTESFSSAEVRIYSKQGASWIYENVTPPVYSRLYVTIGEFDDSYEGNELAFCNYALNSTLGYVGYDMPYSDLDVQIIHKESNPSGVPPPYTKYMCVAIGDRNNDGHNELVYGVDRSSLAGDSIWLYNPLFGSSSEIVSGLEFVCPEITFADFDNDENDEVIYHTVDIDAYPATNISVCDWDGASWKITLIENAAEPYVTSISAGDVDTDEEIEFLYGTYPHAFLRKWDHPLGALWPDETFDWRVNVTIAEPWIYEGESCPINVTIQNLGPYDLEELNITIDLPAWISNSTPTLQQVTGLEAGQEESFTFLLWPLTSGNYTISVDLLSYHPRVYQNSEYVLNVRPCCSTQAEIGQALLDFAICTGNATLLDAAAKVGNWLESVHIQSGSFYGWNANPDDTIALQPGYVLSTARIGRFFLNLFRATGDFDYLVDALDAASFLGDPYEGNMTILDSIGLAWGLYDNGLVESGEIMEFLFETNKELIFNYFAPTLDGAITYLMALAQNGVQTTNWLNSPGITQSLTMPFMALGNEFTETALRASNWLVERIQGNPEWLDSLPPSIRNSNPYVYHTETALAGLGLVLSKMYQQVACDCMDEILVIANRLVDLAIPTGQGTNWQETSWTTNITKMVNSVCWDYGAAGIASALTEAYKATGNQTYLDYAIDAADWMGNALSIMGPEEASSNVTAEALADIVNSMMDIHSSLPVVFVGYFVDPMTSLSGGAFNLSGYVQTIGWHAQDVNITIDIPSAFRVHGQEKTISIGAIPEPGAVIVNWIVTPIAYGEFNIGVVTVSENAGTDTNNATVAVTDLGVTKVAEPTPGFVALSLAQVQEDLYNLGSTVWLPIEAKYYTGAPAINASVKVGDMGTAVVNELGVARIGVSSIEPGTVEIPIYIRYDKTTGITSGTENITIELTFTGLEVYDVTSSSTSSFTGEPVTMSGYVRYAHDGSIVPRATVCLDGYPVALTDETGFFQFQHNEAEPGLINYTITAEADANHRIVVCALSQQVQVEWSPFWTPVTMGIAIGSVAAVVVVIVVIAFKKKKITRPTRFRQRGLVNIPEKNVKK